VGFYRLKASRPASSCFGLPRHDLAVPRRASLSGTPTSCRRSSAPLSTIPELPNSQIMAWTFAHISQAGNVAWRFPRSNYMVPTWCRFVHYPPSLRRRVKAGVTNIFAGTIPVNMVTLDPFVEVSRGKRLGFLHYCWSCSVYPRAFPDLYPWPGDRKRYSTAISQRPRRY